jgi:hypothetical protein
VIVDPVIGALIVIIGAAAANHESANLANGGHGHSFVSVCWNGQHAFAGLGLSTRDSGAAPRAGTRTYIKEERQQPAHHAGRDSAFRRGGMVRVSLQ